MYKIQKKGAWEKKKEEVTSSILSTARQSLFSLHIPLGNQEERGERKKKGRGGKRHLSYRMFHCFPQPQQGRRKRKPKGGGEKKEKEVVGPQLSDRCSEKLAIAIIILKKNTTGSFRKRERERGTPQLQSRRSKSIISSFGRIPLRARREKEKNLKKRKGEYTFAKAGTYPTTVRLQSKRDTGKKKTKREGKMESKGGLLP